MDVWRRTGSLDDDGKADTSTLMDTDYEAHPWTYSCNKVMERAGTHLQADYYPPKSTIVPEVDLDSWQKVDPRLWSNDDVINLIYDLAENCDDICVTELRGEGFQNLLWGDLCQMTEEQFHEREPKYGGKLFELIRQLVPFEDDHQLCEQNLTIKREPDATSSVLCCQTELPKPVEEILVQDMSSPECMNMQNFTFNPITCGEMSEFFPELYLNYSTNRMPSHFSSMSTEPWSPDAMIDAFCSLDPSHANEQGSNLQVLMDQEQTSSFANRVNAISSTTTKRVYTRKRAHGNRGMHLWEFICRLLKMSETLSDEDRIIQWENQKDGVFRIINSKEVARLWGECKRNDLMNYEKLSRALRWCRTYGFLSELPKDGNFPKKLCFRFGPKAENWRNCI